MILEPPQPKFKFFKNKIRLDKVLFISGAYVTHSKKAAELLFKDTRGKCKTDYASILDKRSVTLKQIKWASTIFVLEGWISGFVQKEFEDRISKHKTILNLELKTMKSVKQELIFEVFNTLDVVAAVERRIKLGGKYYTIEECRKMLDKKA